MNNYIDGIGFEKKEPTFNITSVQSSMIKTVSYRSSSTYMNNLAKNNNVTLPDGKSWALTTVYAGTYTNVAYCYLLFNYECDSKPSSVSIIASTSDREAYKRYANSVVYFYDSIFDSLTDTTGKFRFIINDASSFRNTSYNIGYMYIFKIHFNESMQYKAKDFYVGVELSLT